MHLGVTIHAVFADYPTIKAVRRDIDAAQGRARVIDGGMALLAEPRCPGIEEVWIVGSVWVVAVAAVFPYRLMLPEVRSAFLRVAVIAGLIHGAPVQ